MCAFDLERPEANPHKTLIHCLCVNILFGSCLSCLSFFSRDSRVTLVRALFKCFKFTENHKEKTHLVWQDSSRELAVYTIILRKLLCHSLHLITNRNIKFIQQTEVKPSGRGGLSQVDSLGDQSLSPDYIM